MDKLTELADSKTETSLLSLVNAVTLDVIAKVFGLHPHLDQMRYRRKNFFAKCPNIVNPFFWLQVAFGVDLDLLNQSSPFPRAIETCLKGMVINIRDIFYTVSSHTVCSN